MVTLVTGCAGFIGAKCTETLLNNDETIIGIDNLNDYYSVQLKQDRLKRFNHLPNFTFIEADIAKPNLLYSVFEKYKPSKVIHLAAQAGVRYSIENPQSYIDSNISGFFQLLEAARHFPVQHLVFASSSSVYGDNESQPFAVTQNTDKPISLYAATKKSNEVMAYSYSHLYQIPMTGLRFFTVYGPWGRPDMAPIKFARNILAGKPIQIYNHGKHQRDFTYIDDIVAGTLQVAEKLPANHYQLLNIAYGKPIELMRFISLLEQALGKEAIKEYCPAQEGDVEATWADISVIQSITGYQAKTPIEQGVKEFAAWFKEYWQTMPNQL